MKRVRSSAERTSYEKVVLKILARFVQALAVSMGIEFGNDHIDSLWSDIKDWVPPEEEKHVHHILISEEQKECIAKLTGSSA